MLRTLSFLLILILLLHTIHPASAAAETVTIVSMEKGSLTQSMLHVTALPGPAQGVVLTYRVHDYEQGSKERIFQHATTLSTPHFKVIHDTGIVHNSDGEEWMYLSQVVDGRQIVFILR